MISDRYYPGTFNINTKILISGVNASLIFINLTDVFAMLLYQICVQRCI